MTSRTYETTALAKAEIAPDRAAAAAGKAVAGGGAPGAAFGTTGDPGAQAAALTQATGGNLARAGSALLQLQRGYGNHYVQRVVEQARQQSRFDPKSAQADAHPVVATPNRTGMPDQLKAGIESLSGMDLSDVRVHVN